MSIKPKGQMKVSFGEMPDPVSVQLPLRLLLLGDFRFQGADNDGAEKTSERLSIDKDCFGEVLERLVGQIFLTVPNCLSEDPKVLSVSIPIANIKSFHPDALIEAIPSLETLAGTRRLIARAMEGRISSDDCRKQLVAFPGGGAILDRLISKAESSSLSPEEATDEPTPPALPSESIKTNTDLESLLEMVDVPGTSSSSQVPSVGPVFPRVEALLSQVLASGEAKVRLDPKAAQAVLTDLDGQLARQLDVILHHPEFQRLESVWRGVKFLVDRTNFRDAIQMDLLHLPKQDLATHFDSLVVQPELSGYSQVPLTAILADYEFDRSPEDLALLDALAHQAERLQVAVMTSVGLSFFGMRSFDELSRYDDIRRVFDSIEMVKWRALRQDSASRWLVLAFNALLLRYPYGSDHPIQAFPFQESVSSDDGYLWGNPIWVIGVALTGSFSRSGWCTNLVGPRSGGLVGDLPVRSVQFPGAGDGVSPLACRLSEAQLQDLRRAGFLALMSPAQSDTAVILSAPSVFQPESYGDPTLTDQARLQATLPYQLLAARIAHQVSQARGDIGSGGTQQSFQAELSRTLSHVFGLPPADSRQAIVVKEGEAVARAPHAPIEVTVYPDRLGLGNFPPVHLSIPVPQ